MPTQHHLVRHPSSSPPPRTTISPHRNPPLPRRCPPCVPLICEDGRVGPFLGAQWKTRRQKS